MTPQHKEIHRFSLPKVNRYIVCIYPCVFHLSLSIHQCCTVLSLPKQEPAGQCQVYRPSTGGSHKNKEHVLSCNSSFSKTQKIGQIMNHQFCQKPHQSFEFFRKARTFARCLILKFFKTSGLEVITNNKIKEVPNIGTHLRLTSFMVSESGNHMGIATNSLWQNLVIIVQNNRMEIKVLNNHDVSCMY